MTTLLPTRATAPVPVSITARAVGEVAVLRIAGDLDVAGLEPVAAAVRTALEPRPVGLVLDLSAVPFCDTVGQRLLLSTSAQARKQGCATALAGVQGPVADFLVRVCADRSLPSYRDVSDAIEGLMFSAAWR